MNGFKGSYMYRSTETEKKGRKTCRCFPPFVKFHYHDCPAATKPCPVHGNLFHHRGKQQKVDREQNVIISFHPSTKTERLLQPITSLLAHCNSETKINFQYYSPENVHSKDSLKPQNGQNAYESLKKSLNNNVFVERTKSFVANKTSKVKKLKQCFHSPCNSIAQKTRSQTSIKEKLNQILREETKKTRNVFYNMVPEIPPDEKKHDPTSKWLNSNKGSLKRRDFLSDEDSDFITVTQRDKTDTVHHKIFEIKHRKGLNDIPFVGFPKQQTHLVYSTVNVTGRPVEEKKEDARDQKRLNFDKSVRGEGEEIGENLVPGGSEKTNRSVASSSSSSSSSGSVYITPFIFVPRGMGDSDTDVKPKVKQVDVVEEGVQAEDQQTQRPTASAKETQTSLSSEHEETKWNSVLLQTDSFLYEQRICHCSRQVYDREYESATRVERISVGSNERAIITRNYDDESSRQSKPSEISRTVDSFQHTKTAEMQTCSGTICMRTPDSGRCKNQSSILTPRKEVLIQARWDSRTRDKTSQTEDLWNLQVSVKTFDSGMNKSQVSEASRLRFSNKGIQTSFYHNNPVESEFIQLNSPEVTYVIKPFEQQESDQAVDKLAKTWWGKSHSDSDLFERVKCACYKLDAENPYLQSNFSKNSSMNNTPVKSTITKVYESVAVDSGTRNSPPAGNVTLRTKETVERFSDTKQTSTREEELSAAVSDLSELKKIIQEFFEKGNLGSKRTCECVTKEEKVDAQTITDNFVASPKQEHKENFTDKTVQTVYKLNLQENSEETREKKNAGVQTFLENTEKKEAATQMAFLEEPKKAEKNDTEAETNVKVLPEEAEQEKADNQKVKLRQTVVIDKSNQSNTYFVCAVCGRDMKHLIDATTNTSPFPERPKLVTMGTEYTESFEVKMITKKVQNTDNSKAVVKVTTSEKAEDKSGRKTVKQQEDSPRPETAQKSRIPVPNHSTLVRFKNNEAVFQRAAYFPAPNLSRQGSPAIRASQLPFTVSECICDAFESPSTSKGQALTSSPNDPPAKTAKPPKKSDTPRKENAGGNKSRKNNHKHYPVWVTNFWPKEIFNTWKSVEGALSDIPSSDDSKSQTAKPKRSHCKDLEAAAGAGRKTKAHGRNLSQEFPPELSHLLGQICSSNFASHPLQPQEDEKNSTDEEAVKKLSRSLRETSLEMEDDFLLDSKHFSDSSNTENSFFGDEEDEEETTRGQTTAEEPRYKHNASSTQALKLKPQSHSAVTFNKSLSPDDTSTSKSLNAFLIFINPKKHKTPRRKHSK